VRPIKNSRPEISLLPLVQILANHDQFADWFLVSFNVANWQTYCEHVMVHCALSEYSRSRKTTTKLVFEQRQRISLESLQHFDTFCKFFVWLVCSCKYTAWNTPSSSFITSVTSFAPARALPSNQTSWAFPNTFGTQP
jgi:hypothetical protein